VVGVMKLTHQPIGSVQMLRNIFLLETPSICVLGGVVRLNPLEYSSVTLFREFIS
jgi:hypothetical protein